jgi:biotin carboxyl carrier protein
VAFIRPHGPTKHGPASRRPKPGSEAPGPSRSARQAMGRSTADDPQVLDARAALERALLNLLYTTVEAPTAGSTTDLSLTVGQHASAGQPLMTLIDCRAGPARNPLGSHRRWRAASG